MNKYQEALDRLENSAYYGGEKGDNVALLQELVDRSTPIKPMRDMGAAWCKSCDMWVDLENEDVRFCSSCGQAIDRNEE